MLDIIHLVITLKLRAAYYNYYPLRVMDCEQYPILMRHGVTSGGDFNQKFADLRFQLHEEDLTNGFFHEACQFIQHGGISGKVSRKTFYDTIVQIINGDPDEIVPVTNSFC